MKRMTMYKMDNWYYQWCEVVWVLNGSHGNAVITEVVVFEMVVEVLVVVVVVVVVVVGSAK